MADKDKKDELQKPKADAMKPVGDVKPETKGAIPGKSDPAPPVIAGSHPELGNESVPGADPELPGAGFAVIPDKSDHAPAVMAGEPAELGNESVPGSQAKDWQIEPGKSDHAPAVIAGSHAELGTASVPATPRFEPADADDEDASSSGKRVKLRLLGFKGREVPRIPPAVTLIMPDDKGSDQDKAKMAVTSGKTLVVRRDEFKEFSAKDAEWLMGNERFEFEKA